MQSPDPCWGSPLPHGPQKRLCHGLRARVAREDKVNKRTAIVVAAVATVGLVVGALGLLTAVGVGAVALRRS